MNILTLALLIFLLWRLQIVLYRKYWHRGLSFRLSFSAGEAFEGDVLSLRQELTNAKLLPLPWVIAKIRLSRNLRFLDGDSFRISDDFYQSDLYSIAMYQRITLSQRFLCARRGYYRIKGADLSSSNIFLSDKLVERLACDAELIVYPKPDVSPSLEVVFRQLYGEVEVRRHYSPDPFAFRGIREYVHGDDFRRINWNATAKSGGLMVNVQGATASRQVILPLGLEPYSDSLDEEVMEEAIRIAASAASYFEGLGLTVGLVSNGRDYSTEEAVSLLPGGGAIHYKGILEKLARIDLALGQGHMSVLVEEQIDPAPYYLLISPYDRADLQEAFAAMKSRGLSAHWIVPALPEEILWVKETDHIERWEVTPRRATSHAASDIAG
jgi:uncharacterized protein (DUF58 family)